MAKLILKNKKADKESEKKTLERFKVIIVDDESEVHSVTRFALKNYAYQGKGLEFISAYSGEEAKETIAENPDASLILLDVVMEEDDSGLKVVEYVRDELENNLTRIILRTGQPGMAPEEEVILKYDVNDYKEKTELTDKKFITALTMALRSYSDLNTIENYRQHLEDMVSERTAELEKQNKALEDLNRRLEVSAMTDPLTGAFNRLKFDQDTEKEIERCKRYGSHLSLIIFDIDFFKSINDHYGHVAGDSVLKEVVRLASEYIRENDVFARWGGEEFVVLLPEVNGTDSLLAAEKLRKRIECFDFSHIDRLTCSFGVTQFLAEDSFETFINRADEALYMAKQQGRNQVASK